MTNLIAAEFLKLRTTRTFWWLAGAGVVLSGLITFAQLASTGVGSEADARSVLLNITIASILVVLLGVVGSAGEARHGTITSTFLVAPNRTRVVIAKAIAYFLAGVAIGIVSAAVVLVISILWLSGNPAPFGTEDGGGSTFSDYGLDGGELAQIVIGSIALTGVSAVFGVALGSVIPNQTAAVMTVVVLSFVIDPILASIFDGYAKYSLSGVTTAMSGGKGEDLGISDLFSQGVGTLLYMGYTMALLVAAALVLGRRDVT